MMYGYIGHKVIRLLGDSLNLHAACFIVVHGVYKKKNLVSNSLKPVLTISSFHGPFCGLNLSA